MQRDIKSIIILLATQGMINMGEIADPITNEIKSNLSGAKIFIELLEELKVKTAGNLTQKESSYMNEVLTNIRDVYKKKVKGEIKK